MKKHLIIFFTSVIAFSITVIALVVYLDPFFHYHAPLKNFYYELDNERSQNWGIATFFDYDAIITGTSLTEHYKTSVFDELFDTNSVKLPFAGATFYETGNVVKRAFETGHNLKMVFRSFDVNHVVEEKDATRIDLGEYPEYLYNDKWWDDLPYVCNIDIFVKYCIPMLKGKFFNVSGGVTSFDEYQYGEYTAGEFFEEREPLPINENQVEFTDEDYRLLRENLEENVLSIAREHPETEFIYFIPPYNIIWWRDHAVYGDLEYMCEVMEKSAELMLEYDNIKLYSFVDEYEYVTDLSLYQDEYHYSNDINGEILNSIKDKRNLLTKENYKDYFSKIHQYFVSYDYEELIK